tara:strand:- start:531 stop:1019 length:489 start_codon:yes stop_codon:yes gene_type:complete
MVAGRSCARLACALLLAASVAGCEADMTTMDLRSLETRAAHHDALACPAGFCRVTADFDSPDFPVSEQSLMTRVREIIAQEPRTRLADKNETLNQLVFVQRSRVFRFPDTIWIQPVRRGTVASVIIYSRSKYGYGDFGANKRRVRRWLGKLSENIGTAKAGH